MPQPIDQEELSVLLVDDEDEFRQPLFKRLSRRGFHVREACNGREALLALEKEPAGVVVMDVMMPVLDGIEALKRIKQEFHETEVILLTGFSNTDQGVSGIKAGAFDYLSKPIEFEHLLGKIRQAGDKLLRQEEKRRELEFRSRMEQQMIAAERLAAVGTMAAGIAHEINNPLSIIAESAGWMNTLLAKPELASIPHRDGLKLALDKIEKSVSRTRTITHQLLGFVRKDDSVVKESSLSELIQEVIDLMGTHAGDLGVVLEKDVDTRADTIWTDPSQLRQVLVNLVSNAIQASSRDGKVLIRLEDAPEEIILSVKDQGEGIPKENLCRIFEPFFTTKPPGKGTGLGLSISRSLVEKLGGKIDVESQLGKGSTFSVRLPKLNPVADRS